MVFIWGVTSYLNLQNMARCCMVRKARPDFAWSIHSCTVPKTNHITLLVRMHMMLAGAVSRDKKKGGPEIQSVVKIVHVLSPRKQAPAQQPAHELNPELIIELLRWPRYNI